MIIAARQARTANRFAPSQTRRTNAQAWLFGRYAPSMLSWLDAYKTQYAIGATIPTSPDCSGKFGSITQVTPSKQPLCEVKGAIKAFRFDGVNDCLQTGTLPLNIQTLSIISFSFQSSGTGVIAETGAGTGATDMITHTRGDTVALNITGFYVGNVGQQYKRSNNGYSSWVQAQIIADKGAIAANELAIYGNNVAPTIAGPVTSENTNTFGSYVWNYGSRNNGVALAFNGWISQAIVLSRVLTAAERQDFYRQMQEMVGLGWT